MEIYLHMEYSFLISRFFIGIFSIALFLHFCILFFNDVHSYIPLTWCKRADRKKAVSFCCCICRLFYTQSNYVDFFRYFTFIVWKNAFFSPQLWYITLLRGVILLILFLLHPAILYEQFGWHEFIGIVSNFRLCLLSRVFPFILILFRFISIVYFIHPNFHLNYNQTNEHFSNVHSCTRDHSGFQLNRACEKNFSISNNCAI